jgi:hypothetical protein
LLVGDKVDDMGDADLPQKLELLRSAPTLRNKLESRIIIIKQKHLKKQSMEGAINANKNHRE